MRIKTQTPPRLIVLIAFALLGSSLFTANQRISGQAEQKLDPAAWGSNHVGKPVPDFVRGDECLFCHRNSIGPQSQKNAHGAAVRQIEEAGVLRDLLKQPELASTTKEIEYVLGSRHHIRFLKKEGFGAYAILNTQAVIDANAKPTKWIETEKPAWDKTKFGNNCAGCHATGVDTKTKQFAAFGLDCYVCHGDVKLEHTNDTKLMILSKKRRNEAELITATCAQCHLREGKAKSTGLPYPNNFVAGDNLFQDFAVDWAKADDEKLNPIDRHIYRNARDVVVYGKTSTTCINCHQVHYES